jgi:hypothetical protein
VARRAGGQRAAWGARAAGPRAERTVSGGQGRALAGSALPAGGAGGAHRRARGRVQLPAGGSGGACARSGLTGGVEAAGDPCGGVAGVAPPAAPAAGACRDAAAFQNFGARPGGKRGMCIPTGGYRRNEKCANFTAGAVDFLRPLPPLPRAGGPRRSK